MMNNKEKASWLAGLLSGWGIKESWAKVIAGAIIGALCAAGILTAGGCTASYRQAADGSMEWRGAMALPAGNKGK